MGHWSKFLAPKMGHWSTFAPPPPRDAHSQPTLGGGSPRISKYWGAKSKKSPKYLVLNGRKKPKYLVLKKPKTFMAHLGLKQHSIALYFRFLLHFYAKIGSRAHFLGQKCQIFLKKAPSAPTFWALRAQNIAPHPKILRGKNILFSGIGGRAPHCPRLCASPPPRDAHKGGDGGQDFGREAPKMLAPKAPF